MAEPPTLKAPVDSKSLDFESLPTRLEQAEGELASSKPELAYMLAWGTAEAAIRGLLADEGHSITDIPTTSSLLAQAQTLDVISEDEHEVLTRLNTYRNAIAHGYGVPDFTDTLVTELIKVVRRVVEAATRPGDVPQSEAP